MGESHHQRALELGRKNAARRPPRYRSLLLHWLGRRFRRPAPARPVELVPVEPGQLSVTWGGHAMCLVRYAELGIALDPLLARSVSGIRRERGPGLDADHLSSVDLVLISSAAPDHLDPASIARLPRAATVVVPPGAGARLSPLRFRRLLEVGPGGSFAQNGVEVSIVSVRQGRKDPPAQAYLVRGNGPSVYACGQSGYFDGFAELGATGRPDVALLPIAGYWPPSFRERRMSPLDALYAFEDLKARVMIPIGFGALAMSYERLHDPERWLAELVAERGLEDYVVALEPGESRVFVRPPPAALRDEASGRAWAVTARASSGTSPVASQPDYRPGTSIADAVLAAAGAATSGFAEGERRLAGGPVENDPAGVLGKRGQSSGEAGGTGAGSGRLAPAEPRLAGDARLTVPEGEPVRAGESNSGSEQGSGRRGELAEAVPEVINDTGGPGFEGCDTEMDATPPDGILIATSAPVRAPAAAGGSTTGPVTGETGAQPRAADDASSAADDASRAADDDATEQRTDAPPDPRGRPTDAAV